MNWLAGDLRERRAEVQILATKPFAVEYVRGPTKEHEANGQQLVDQLRSLGLTVEQAFWHCEDENSEYEFHVISSDARTYGQIAVYRLVDEAAAALPMDQRITFGAVHVWSPKKD